MSNPFRIIYEDEDLVVVSKKEGICVVRGRGSLADIPSVVDMLRDIYQSIFVVHRIDMETSGIVVFAKNPLSHRELSILFEKRKVFKRYLALVWGRISSRLIVDKPIKEFSSGRSAVSDEGKPSTTVIKPLSFFRRFSLIEVFPHTGRRHQIRVHLYSIGHPIVGDQLYGDKEKQSFFKRMFLHSASISFKLKGKIYRFDDSNEFIDEINEALSEGF